MTGLFGCFAMDAKGSYSLIALTISIKIYVVAAIITAIHLDLVHWYMYVCKCTLDLFVLVFDLHTCKCRNE